jgi:hypothetical protein
MRKHAATIATAATIALPTANGFAALLAPSPKKTSTTWKTVVGPLVPADRWGNVQVALVIRKRTTTVRTKRFVARRITAVRVPAYPKEGAHHTISLNRLVIPVLAQQVLDGQLRTKIQLISEATDTSTAFDTSLQAALVKARRV